MKISRILFGLAVASVFTACSSSDDYNSASNVTVSMKETTISWKESKGLLNVPIIVTGEANGPIKVEVSVSESGSTPATADLHYFVTSTTLNIPEGETEVNVEINPVDDEEINETRTFVVTIASAEGAKIGTEASCLVSLRDNDAEFYEKLQGGWTLNYLDEGEKGSVKVSIAGADEEDADYNNVLYLRNLGTSGTEALMNYHFDMATSEVTLELPFGQPIGQVNFTGLGVCDVYLATVVGNSYSLSGSLHFKMSPDAKTLTCVEEDLDTPLVLIVVSGGSIKGYWYWYDSVPSIVR